MTSIIKSGKTITSILALVLIDQTLKTFLIGYLKTKPGYLIELLPFLDIVYAWNYGISFGLFREYYQYSNYIFLGLNIIITLWLCYTLRNSATILSRSGLILIIGGALGNLIDRGIRGAVFDFILVHYRGFEFPVFNFADSAITIGAIIFAYDYFFLKKSLEE
jgi:signal peptidase II